VEAKYGVTPAQYPDVAALRGDSSDNLPGVPKVGDKTAAKWIVQYGTLSELIAHADEVKGKVGESFRAHLPQVQLNRRITELSRDLDLGVEMADLARSTPERADVNALFDRLEFGAQARTRFLTAFLPEGAPEPVTEIELEQASVLGAGDVSDWLASHAPAGQRRGVVAAAPPAPGGGDAQTVTIAAAGGAAGHIALAASDPADEQALQAWIGDDAVSKAFHDAKSAI